MHGRRVGNSVREGPGPERRRIYWFITAVGFVVVWKIRYTGDRIREGGDEGFGLALVLLLAFDTSTLSFY